MQWGEISARSSIERSEDWSCHEVLLILSSLFDRSESDMKSETAKTTLTMTSLRKESRLRTAGALLRKDWQLYSLLILPVIYLIIFKYGPMIGNVIAFRRFVPGGSIFGETWVGLRYFQMFVQDPTFWKVFGNTLILGGLALLFTFPVPIIFALLLNEVKVNASKVRSDCILSAAFLIDRYRSRYDFATNGSEWIH